MKVLVLVALWFLRTFYFKIFVDRRGSAAPKPLSCLERKKEEILLQMLRSIHQKLRIRHALLFH
jgi:hypothetical protein